MKRTVSFTEKVVLIIRRTKMSFNLYMFESDFKEIRDFVLGYTNIETGGDLFGLWKASGDPVVQLIIGPGQKSRRTSVSFHQDTDYLARVGTYVNTKFMLCHIGSWHSHHQLSLKQPSAGDRSTVCNNFPPGLKRYIMIIANITRDKRQPVAIHPYMFTRGGHVCNDGKVKLIPEQNPFREDGYVLRCIDQGKECPPATSEAYASAAPPGYHNRPSTQSRLRDQTIDTFKTNPTNKRSYSPMKNVSNQHRSMHQHDHIINTRHQNFFSTDDSSAGRHSPMDVDQPMDTDPPHNHCITQQQQTSHSQYHVKSPKHLDNTETQQWYETEKGGAIVKEIHQEVTKKMASNIDYQRDANSKDLTMKFRHGNKKWMVIFPKSFSNEPAVIRNETTGGSKLSKNILEDIREMCCCTDCQTILRHNDPHSPSIPHPTSYKRDPSPSKRDPSPYRRDPSPSKQVPSPFERDASPTTHSPPSTPIKRDRQPPRYRPYTAKSESRPPTGRRRQSPSQPWYNTATGKATVEKIKTELCTYLRSTTNSGKVETLDTHASKKLSFYHSSEEWVVEFCNNANKDVTIKFHGMTKALKHPYDVVSVLTDGCPCAECRLTKRSPSPGRRPLPARPNSRYGRINQRSPTRVSSTPSPNFFASGRGEEQFKKILTDISTLSEKNVDIQRHINSRKIEVNFEHSGRKWKVVFPFRFPEESADVSSMRVSKYQRVNQFIRVPVGNDGVIRAIRKKCRCQSCERYRF